MTRATDKLLIVDDEAAICFAFKRYFEARGCAVQTAASAAEGLRALAATRPDLVFLDIRLPDRSGLEVLREMLAEQPDALVVLITAYTSLETVGEAMREGAFDYLVKPLDLDRATDLVREARETRNAVRQTPRPSASGAGSAELLIGDSRAMQAVCKAVARAAVSDASVLITGETGTGKEVVAQAIHAHSARGQRPFVAVNCAALPEQLMESELFGYVQGAFTGATDTKPGRFEAAAGGTLLLDEIGDLPLGVQVKLLRFLDQHKIERLGSLTSLQLDVRVLAATHRDLQEAVQRGDFREDLYYRLAVIQMNLPPLRERGRDSLALANHFLAELAGGDPPPLARDAAGALEACPWPGNVRQLRNAVEHAFVASGGRTILLSHLPEAVRQGAPPRQPDSGALQTCVARYLEVVEAAPGELHAAALEPVEAAVIRRAMQEAGSNQTAAAKLLGIHRNTLREKLRTYGLAGRGA